MSTIMSSTEYKLGDALADRNIYELSKLLLQGGDPNYVAGNHFKIRKGLEIMITEMASLCNMARIKRDDASAISLIHKMTELLVFFGGKCNFQDAINDVPTEMQRLISDAKQARIDMGRLLRGEITQLPDNFPAELKLVADALVAARGNGLVVPRLLTQMYADSGSLCSILPRDIISLIQPYVIAVDYGFEGLRISAAVMTNFIAPRNRSASTSALASLTTSVEGSGRTTIPRSPSI